MSLKKFDDFISVFKFIYPNEPLKSWWVQSNKTDPDFKNEFIESWDSLMPVIYLCQTLDTELNCDLLGNITCELLNNNIEETYELVVNFVHKYGSSVSVSNKEFCVCEQCDNTDNFTLEKSFNYDSAIGTFEKQPFDARIICDSCSCERCFMQKA